jgi:dynein heavy chain
VGECLEPALDSLLQRRVARQGGRQLVRVGDADVDCDPAFKLFMTTKLANPRYLPEVATKVTLINFSVTQQVRVSVCGSARLCAAGVLERVRLRAA